MLPKNTIEELYDAIRLAVSSSETQKMISNQIEDIDNPVLKEAIESSVQTIFFSLFSKPLKSSKASKLGGFLLSKIRVKRIRVKAHKLKLRSKNKRYKVLKKTFFV